MNKRGLLNSVLEIQREGCLHQFHPGKYSMTDGIMAEMYATERDHMEK